NLVWPILNLLPIWPLDGGQISRELFTWRMPSTRGIRASLILSIVTSVALALLIVVAGKYIGVGWLAASFFGVFAYLASQELQRLGGGGGWGQPPPRQRAPWQVDPDWWKKGTNPWNNP